MSDEVRVQTSVFDGTAQSLYNKSVELIKTFEAAALARSPHGYLVGYSGGKDSDALVELFKRAGVKFKVYHNHTTLDAPETVYYVRKKFAEFEAAGIECEIVSPRISFWGLVRKYRILPTRKCRFCCSELKENGGEGEPFAVRCFGVRKAESVSRASKRDSIELRDRKRDFSGEQHFHFDNAADVEATGACYVKHYFILNPLAYWSDEYLSQFIACEKIETNPLYREGFERVGCIGCPMGTAAQRRRQFERYPRFEALFVQSCKDIWKAREERGDESTAGWKCWQDLWQWYLDLA